MIRQKKSYKTPSHAWDKERIEREREILKSYGLKKKVEIWKAETFLRKFRHLARKLAATKDKETEKIIIDKLSKLGVLGENATIDDVLGLTLEKVLQRRLQTVLVNRGLVTTSKQARQYIVHGHVMINGRKIIYPSYIVPKDEETKIQLTIIPQMKKVEPPVTQ
ncbi:MAG: 30S ribosomal protein S4 [Candidatus Aenigmarchaeota archaeon]|nr:30S ribosomal protein S4 [Candidatus Aenigmarchaeota archaeon]